MSAPKTDTAREFIVDIDDDGIRVDRWFKRHLPDANFNLVSRWARTGALRVDGARVQPGDRLAAGQTLQVPPPEVVKEAVARPKRERTPLNAEQTALAESMVIHKDAAAIVLNKPPGLATQGGTKTIEHVDGLLDALQYEMEGRPKLVHRLDKDTSGALLIARTARAAAFFSKSFSGRTARKIYWALVAGVPDIADGMIDLPIAKQPGSGGEKMHISEHEGQPSRSRYRIIERVGNRAAWVELQPLTGRTHQLRVHMAAIGHPIVGDGKYGGLDAFLTGGVSRKMHLHARRIRIDHPDGGRIDVTAELPAHFADSVKLLGLDLSLGDQPLPDEGPPPTRAEQKQFAKDHAKAIRKDRKGERRGRGVSADPNKPTISTRKAPAAAPGKPRAGKPAFGKPAAGGARTGRSEGGPRTGKPATGAPARGKPTGGPSRGPSPGRPTGKPPAARGR